MAGLIPFAFDDHTIRAIEIDGRPWFVGRDVAAALGFADTVNALKQHCKGVVKRHPLQTAGGVRGSRPGVCSGYLVPAARSRFSASNRRRTSSSGISGV